MSCDAARRYRAILLDRDGVINRERGHVRRLEDFEILPGVPEAIARLNEHGTLVAVLTNQSGIARGYLTEEELQSVHGHLGSVLARAGARIDYLAYSPWLDQPGLSGGVERFLRDHPDRKPNPGMLVKACRRFGIESAAACYVGDTPRDREAALRADMDFYAVRSAKADQFEKGTVIRESLAEFVDDFLAGRLGMLSDPPRK